MKTIELSQGQIAFVDDEDFEKVSRITWWAQRGKNKHNWYARGYLPAVDGKRRKVLLHKFVLSSSGRIDHKNGNSLDCQKSNLRAATNSQNIANAKKRVDGITSKFKGVYWNKQTRCWRAKAKRTHLGDFLNESDAARAYDKEAKKVFGEFARLNFPVRVDS